MENINKTTGIRMIQDITESYNYPYGLLTRALPLGSEISQQESPRQPISVTELEVNKKDEGPREKLIRFLQAGEKLYIRSDNTNITAEAPDDCAYFTIPKGRLSLIGNSDEVDRIFNDSDLSNIIYRVTASGEVQTLGHESLEDPNLLVKREELKKKLLSEPKQTILRDSDISEVVDSISIPRTLKGAGPFEEDGSFNTLKEVKKEEMKSKREALKAKLLRGEKISLLQNTPSNDNGPINIPKGGLFARDPTAEDLERIKAIRAYHTQHTIKMFLTKMC